MSNFTHYRKGNKVYTVDDTLEFNGAPENMQKGLYNDSNVTYKRGKKSIKCTARFYVNRGVNKAKRYVRKNNLNSYNKDS
ncbi:MAG: hypothetical protein GY707_05455 [Desulfobacteraceae bacterium]|nr:hypothetical protein [Desulfobacteraceae bacterium]